MRLSTLLRLAAALSLAFALAAPSALAQDRLRGETSPPFKTSQDRLGSIVADGSFEDGTPNPSWTEASASFGTPICNVAGCGSGGGSGPRTGAFWVWFGGASAGDVGSMEQTVTIPTAASADLLFWLEIPVIDAGGTGFVAALIDGTEVFRATYADDQATYNTYALATVDASAFADGGDHLLRFESTTTGSGNFFVDDVSIEAMAAGSSLTITPGAVAFADTQLGMTAMQDVTLTSSGSVAVNISEIALTGDASFSATGTDAGTLDPGMSRTVTITFAPTETGDATGTLTVTSDAPNSPATVSITGTGIPVSDVQTFPSTDTPIPITDNTPAGITSTITIPASDTRAVLDADIQLDITHTWVGDLIGTVSHDAASVIAWDRPGLPTSAAGCSANNMVIILDDEGTAGAVETACEGIASTAEAFMTGARYTPNNPLAAFDDAPFAGDWTLNVSDNANIDTGTLNSWALLLTPMGGVADEQGSGTSVSRLSVAPNPAVGSAQIDLTVGTTQDIRVTLYDALGREVAVLFDRTMSAGQQAYIALTTTDLPSGVYVVRAAGTDLSLTQRVTVVR